MPEPTGPPILKFTGHKYFTQRLVLSTLTGRPVRISGIRASSTDPGVQAHEVSFLRLLDAITNGSVVDFSPTGTIVAYKPGLITGSAAGHGAATHGAVLRHEIPKENTRGVSWFLVPLCLLAPFSKQPVNVLFTGPGVITSATDKGDVGVDTVRTAILPLYAHFGIQNKLELRILRRSCAGPGGRGGGGEVQLTFAHQVRLPKTIHLMNPGRVKKIQGVAYAIGVAGANNQRMIESARAVMNAFARDVYIFSDVSSAPFAPLERGGAGAKRKIGIGFGMSLLAESSTGVLYSADVVSPHTGGETPEDVGRKCAYQLLEVISKGGCASPLAAHTMLMLMAMGSEDVGRLQLGRDVMGSEDTIALCRDLRAFGATGWGLRDAGGESLDIVVSVVGRGVGNVGRKIA